MKNINPDLMKQTLKKPWLTVKDIYQIYPCGISACRGMFKSALQKAKDENWFIPITNPPVVPTPHVLQLYPIKGAKKC